MDLITKYQQYTFLPASFFSYDASEEVINYDPIRLNKPNGKISLLHEISHCELGHFNYQYDIELLMMEVDAWHYTKKLADQHGIGLDESYIQDCIDSYKDWVELRGTCPRCNNYCFEQSKNLYSCFVCSSMWQVSSEPQEEITKQLLN